MEDKLEKILSLVQKLPDLVLKGGLAYAGYKALDNPLGAVYSLLGYKLATNTGGASTVPNVCRVAGLAILAHVGISNTNSALWRKQREDLEDLSWIKERYGGYYPYTPVPGSGHYDIPGYG